MMVCIHMVAHEYIYNFSNFKYFLYFWWTGFVIRFFPGFVQVLIRFRFSGSVGLTTGSVFVTLLFTHTYSIIGLCIYFAEDLSLQDHGRIVAKVTETEPVVEPVDPENWTQTETEPKPRKN